MQDWTRINSAVIRRDDRLTASGPLGQRSLISPYDIPDAVRAYYERGASTFVAEFRYATEEPLVRRDQGEQITLWIGKNSGRLYRVEAKISDVKPGDRVTLMISEAGVAIDKLSAEKPLFKRRANYSLVKELLGRASEFMGAQVASGH